MLLIVFGTTYPFAPVSADVVGGAEQILSQSDCHRYFMLCKSFATGRPSERSLEVLYA